MEKNDDSMWGSGVAGVGKNEQAKVQYVGV